MTDLNRRKLIKRAGVTIATIPVVSLIGTRALHAADMVDPADAQAAALKYVEKTEVEGSMCSNCILYTGEEGAASGPCSLFAGKHVTAEGWCNVWQKKPA